MHHNIPQILSLNPGEQKLLDQITFELGHGDKEVLKKSCEAASTLATLLLQREAIPEIRVRFFTQPEFNTGVEKSRFQAFESDGVTGYAIFSDPRFLEYLHYFIYGPKLPAQVITEFCNIAYPYEYISGGDIKDLRELAISLIYEYKLVPGDVACEFFKLALECKMDVYYAQSIRDTVCAIK
jgi:hypothetical protein